MLKVFQDIGLIKTVVREDPVDRPEKIPEAMTYDRIKPVGSNDSISLPIKNRSFSCAFLNRTLARPALIVKGFSQRTCFPASRQSLTF